LAKTRESDDDARTLAARNNLVRSIHADQTGQTEVSNGQTEDLQADSAALCKTEVQFGQDNTAQVGQEEVSKSLCVACGVRVGTGANALCDECDLERLGIVE
jgi:hypothetical protein